MRRLSLGLALALVVAFGLFAAGCGSSDNNSSSGSSSAPTATNTSSTSDSNAGADTGSATLRANLTGLLEDHVYLAGFAVKTGVAKGLDSDAFKAAAGALDRNSVALSEAIGSVYGSAAGKQFLALWRKHIGFFVDYTKGKATKNAALAQKAQSELDGYRQDFGAFIASANPNLSKEDVANELTPHVQSLSKAIDSVVAGKATAYADLAAAAAHMPMTAKVLAGAISQQFPDKFSGSADAPASELRAGLTGLLEDHVYLASAAVDAGVNNGLDSKPFKAAAATLDKNSVALSDAIASVYGEDAGKQFLALWRKHIGFFVDYTKAKATKDAAGAKKALAELDGYRQDFGAFIASANPNLPKEAVAQELKPHVASLAAAIRADVKGSPKTFELIQAAAAHMPMTAAVLANGIAKQFPDKFPSA